MCIKLQASIAADHSSGTQNTYGLTWNVGSSGAARSFRIMEFFFIIHGVHFVLQFLNLNHKLIHCYFAFFLLLRKFII